MKFAVLSAAILLAVVICESSPPAYMIDLDLPPETRYDHIIPHYAKSIHKLHKIVSSKLSPTIRSALEKAFERFKDSEYGREIVGIGRLLSLPPVEVFVLNMMYELFTACTAILARNPAGHVLLARNLDFDFPEYLRPIYVVVEYVKGGVTQYKCATMAGFVGGVTCMKPQGFAVALNTRTTLPVETNVESLASGIPSITWVIRAVVENSETFDSAFARFNHAQTAAGGYIILAGTRKNEGAVLTLARTGTKSVQRLSAKKWYLVQCNDDPWTKGDNRTQAATRLMRKMNKGKVTLGKLREKVLMKKPVLVAKTLGNVLMDPATGRFEAEIVFP